MTTASQAASTTSSAIAKNLLRQDLLRRRRGLAETAVRALEADLNARVTQLLERLEPKTVACYWPIRGEPDIRGSLNAWRDVAPETRRLALPVIVADDAPLAFHSWCRDDPMQAGPHRIPIPQHGEAVQPDLVLIPCVGFDARCFRLGYGGGFYDRTLAAFAPRPLSIGVAWQSACVSPALPTQAHDIPLDGVVTDQTAYGAARF